MLDIEFKFGGSVFLVTEVHNIEGIVIHYRIYGNLNLLYFFDTLEEATEAIKGDPKGYKSKRFSPGIKV